MLQVEFRFEGDTKQCFDHFFSQHTKHEDLHFVAGICGVKGAAVRRWKRGNLPMGEPLLRLRYLLSRCGYLVSEFVSLPDYNRAIAEIIALDVLGFDEVVRELNYSDDKGLFDFVLRGRSAIQGRYFSIESMIENYKVTVETARSDYMNTLRLRNLIGSSEAGLGQSAEQVVTPSENGFKPTVAGETELSVESLRELIRRMGTKIDQLEEDLRAEQEAHQFTREKLAAAQASSQTLRVDKDVAELAERYLG